MLFNFQTFIQELRENPDKKETVEKYEECNGPIEGSIHDQEWYKSYLSNFEVVDYLMPPELERDFDWSLLAQLVAGSFSSNGILQLNEEGKIELTIFVRSHDNVADQKIHTLWGFQILRLYEIYAEEQMNLQILIWEDEEEKKAILQQRRVELKLWNEKIAVLKTEDDINDLLGDL